MNFGIGNDRLTLPPVEYRGRIAPTPTGYLHLGHARTFSIAHQRARRVGGEIVYRCEDLDVQRCKPEFAAAAIEDLHWLGLDWDGGPDVGLKQDFWVQSRRHEMGCYLDAWRLLKDLGLIYPCETSRRVLNEVDRRAPMELGGERIFPEAFRFTGSLEKVDSPGSLNWRFRVDYGGPCISISDGNLGRQKFKPGEDYGDFLVWRKDGVPSYELAVVVDDILMRITEVVRGADLWVSTARQLELYAAFRVNPPDFFHCELVKDEGGKRLAKQAGSLGIRALRAQGWLPSSVLREADTQV